MDCPDCTWKACSPLPEKPSSTFKNKLVVPTRKAYISRTFVYKFVGPARKAYISSTFVYKLVVPARKAYISSIFYISWLYLPTKTLNVLGIAFKILTRIVVHALKFTV